MKSTENPQRRRRSPRTMLNLALVAAGAAFLAACSPTPSAETTVLPQLEGTPVHHLEYYGPEKSEPNYDGNYDNMVMNDKTCDDITSEKPAEYQYYQNVCDVAQSIQTIFSPTGIPAEELAKSVHGFHFIEDDVLDPICGELSGACTNFGITWLDVEMANDRYAIAHEIDHTLLRYTSATNIEIQTPNYKFEKSEESLIIYSTEKGTAIVSNELFPTYFQIILEYIETGTISPDNIPTYVKPENRQFFIDSAKATVIQSEISNKDDRSHLLNPLVSNLSLEKYLLNLGGGDMELGMERLLQLNAFIDVSVIQ